MAKDYKELVRLLKDNAERLDYDGWVDTAAVMEQAAEAIEELLKAAKAIPAADVVEVVRCLDCKHRIVNEHFGEKGYMRLKAECELDTGDPFELGRNAEDDDWFCADGERKDGGKQK